MNRIGKQFVSMLATGLLALWIFPTPGHATKSAVTLYKNKVKELDKKIQQLDRAAQQARHNHNKHITDFRQYHKKMTDTLKRIVKSHKKKRTWDNVNKAKRLAKQLNKANEKFELKVRSQIRKIYHIERNRTQLLHQRADASMNWSVAELSRRIEKLRLELQKEEEPALANLIDFLLKQRDALMKQRITVHSIFKQNMNRLSLQEANDLKKFASPSRPD